MVRIAGPGSHGSDFLVQAAAQDKPRFVSLLLSKGYDINYQDQGGPSPLSGTSVGGHEKMIRFLISRGAEVNRKNNGTGGTPLMAAAEMFDLVTAVETHFWWTNLPGGMREIFRVLNPGSTLIFIAEIYKGATTTAATFAEKYAARVRMTLLSVDEHREHFTSAGYSNVQVIEERDKAWICALGRKPIANS